MALAACTLVSAYGCSGGDDASDSTDIGSAGGSSSAGSGGSAGSTGGSGGGKGGAAGKSGASGAAGKAGAAGASGAAGAKGGSAGASGAAGKAGSAGGSGKAGSSGAAGSSGSAGKAGSGGSGTAGTGGSSGAGGGAGKAGSSGTAGSAGSGGCVAKTCAELGFDCGMVNDSCGGMIDCGTCPAGKTCSGAGQPNVCGVPPCTPTTCQEKGVSCGPIGDGCGNQLDCGTCTGSDTCGGGGVPGQCGNSTVCTPKSCAEQSISCGPAGDGCGNALDCGTCPAGTTCGGGGTPGQCGAPVCVPKTCADLGLNCGPAADGCGKIIQCGTCSLPQTCGGAGMQNVCGVPATCTNLCLQQQSCPGGATTTITGKVFTPNGVDPLPGALVYVPNAPVEAFPKGVSCQKCTDGVSGSPLVSATTDLDGSFTISNVPVGQNIPLVMQLGRWRRQVTVNVNACTNNPVDAAKTHMPRNQGEGDIPLMAFATGSVDALECVLRKVGIDDAEFTKPPAAPGGQAGRVQIWVGDGTVKSGNKTYHIGGANAGAGTPAETTLVNSPSWLGSYDMVFFPCKGAEYDRTNVEQKNLIDYANAGGRVFATHFSYAWLYNDAPFSGTAAWKVNQCDPNTTPSCSIQQGYPPDQDGVINQSFPKGAALAQWLQNIGASTAPGKIPLNTLRWDTTTPGAIPPSQQWMSIQDPDIGEVLMHYTFNTPVGASSDQQCGRVLFDDFHVENHGYINQGSAYNLTFPSECAAGPMTPQEKLLEFMIFDLASCVTPDKPTCTPKDCASQNIGCGQAGDGCGGVIDCGTCPAGTTCGGGGTPSQCGAPSCAPKTCADQGIQCGPAGDGCGNQLSCGTCPAGQTCGGGGKPGVCGNQACSPLTCASQNIACGPAGDGCGNALDCGTCPPGTTCGGGGVPGQCGAPPCVPTTCAQLGFNCGQAADGCGGLLQCGTCQITQTCGGGGTPNVCGGTQKP